MVKSIDTLVVDIEKLFEGHGFSSALEHFSTDLGKTFLDRFVEYGESKEFTLRLSNYGRPLRQLWYESRNYPREALSASTKFKFLYGHILEALLLLLSEESGHRVEWQQREVSVGGVPGHIDAIIDGVVVDVKSASTFSFNKFRTGGIRLDDPFGYIPQLAAYSTGLGGFDGAFLVVDKTLGNIHLERFSKEELESYDVIGRIAEDRLAIASPEPPERCYEPISISKTDKSGNLKLGVGCAFCGWKEECWKDVNNGEGLKTYIYSHGPVYLTKVVKEPRVQQQDNDIV